MRVLTAEEVDRLERASLPVEARPLMRYGPTDLETGLVYRHYLACTESINDLGGPHYQFDITPRGQLALRCHRAYLESGGGR